MRVVVSNGAVEHWACGLPCSKATRNNLNQRERLWEKGPYRAKI